MKKFDTVERIKILEKTQQCLFTEEGKPGLDYLIEKRKLSEDLCKEFGLGFMPSNISHMLRNRIIFPIYDASDNLICLSSRSIDKTYDDLPVYWHETYEKSFYLYGLNIAKEHIRNHDYVIVVEGQFDVLQMHKHGFKNTVGIFSTNIGKIQLASIYRYTENIILLLDTDKNNSGKKGIDKAFENLFSLSTYHIPQYKDNVTYIQFDENLDPDEFLMKYGRNPLEKIINKKILELKGNND